MRLLSAAFVVTFIANQIGRAAPPQRDKSLATHLTGSPEFSADGKFVAVVEDLPHRSLCAYSSFSIERLHILSTTNWNPTTKLGDEIFDVETISWSRQSNELLAYLGSRPWLWSESNPHWWQWESPPNRYEMGAKWRPDGESLLLCDDGRLIWKDLNGQRLRLPESLKRIRAIPREGFNWSPDGKAIWVVWCNTGDGRCGNPESPTHKRHGLYRVSLENGKMEMVKRMCNIERVFPSPTGEHVACACSRDGERDVLSSPHDAVLEIKTGKWIKLGEAAPRAPIRWHSDGTELLFDGANKTRGSRVYNIAKVQSTPLPSRNGKVINAAVYHPKTQRIWAIQDDAVVELVDGQWKSRCHWDGRDFIRD